MPVSRQNLSHGEEIRTQDSQKILRQKSGNKLSYDKVSE